MKWMETSVESCTIALIFEVELYVYVLIGSDLLHLNTIRIPRQNKTTSLSSPSISTGSVTPAASRLGFCTPQNPEKLEIVQILDADTRLDHFGISRATLVQDLRITATRIPPSKSAN